MKDIPHGYHGDIITVSKITSYRLSKINRAKRTTNFMISPSVLIPPDKRKRMKI